MPDTSAAHVEASDAQLIEAVRDGNTGAYATLFERHRDAAARLSSQLVPGPDADDLVAESFTRVLALLEAGKGPDEFFRAYLLTSIRRLHVDRTRRQKRVRSTDDQAELDRTIEFVDPAEMRFEQGAAAAAFATLPERWQLVLWHLDVERQRPADVAPLLGMSANSVSALAYRAREGLRQAYLQNHLAPSLHASCRTTTGMLGSYVRKGLSARDSARVEAHLDECSRCTGLYLELTEINSNLSGILGPAVLGIAATGYVGSGAVATGIGAAVEAALVPVKAAGSAMAGVGTQGVVSAAVVVTVATAGTIAITNSDGNEDKVDVPSAQVAPAPTPSIAQPTEPEPATSTATPTPTETTPVPGDVAPGADASSAVQPAEQPRPKPTTLPAVPVVPTDYRISSVRVSNQLLPLLQRQITIDIGASNTGRAAAETVTVTLAFRYPVHFGGVLSPGWDCGSAVPHQQLRALTCSTRLDAGQGTTFVAESRDLVHSSGTITVTAPGDPNAANNSASFRAGLWPLT